MKDAGLFFCYVRERQKIFLIRRDGAAKPWTDDKVLQSFRFCNVFREDDTTTKWIREHFTDVGYGSRLAQAIMIARWFNRIETLELLLPSPISKPPIYEHNMFYSWDGDEVRRRLENVKPIVTAAYVIATKPGMSKLDGVISSIENALGPIRQFQQDWENDSLVTLETATAELTTIPYLGPFMAYELVTDLRHTGILGDAPDIMTWANPGPGCARGASRVIGEDPEHLSRHSKKDRPVLMGIMRSLLALSRDPAYWPKCWPAWEMRDVEHGLCEFDKYLRATLDEGRPKQRFNGA